MSQECSLDLRSVTRPRQETHISLDGDDWIVCGEVELQQLRYGWCLFARGVSGVTDIEHDSIRVLSLWISDPVADLGLSLLRNQIVFTAFVIGDAKMNRVPPSGYDPEKIPGSEQCEECDEPHTIVPEGFYSGPPVNEALFRRIVGKTIRVSVRPLTR